MPKPIPVLIEVEEIALGAVMNKLHNMPGVIKFGILMGDTKDAKAHANGHANGRDKPAKPQYQGDETGEQFILRILKKAPMNAAKIQAAFEKEGRSPGSYAAQVHTMKKDGLLQQKEQRGDYSLTKKGRDRARFV